MGPEINIFAIYAREDKDVMLRLLHHLNSLKEDFNVIIWNDDPIDPGQQWKPQIESRLHEADIFLLLLSDAFMHSEFIQQLEFKMVIDRYKENKSVVFPIIIEPCPWDIDFNSDDYDFNFKELQVLPELGKPLVDWDSPDKAYEHITTMIKRAIPESTGTLDQEESEKDNEQKAADHKGEDQEALDLRDVSEAKGMGEEAQRPLAEEANGKAKKAKRIWQAAAAEATAKAEGEKRRMEEAAAIKKTEEAQGIKQKAAAEATRKTEAEKRRLEEAEAARKTEEAQRIKQAAAAAATRKAEAEKRRLEEAAAIKKTEEKQWINQEAEATRKAEAVKRRLEKAEIKGKSGIADQLKQAAKGIVGIKEIQWLKDTALNKWVVRGAFGVMLTILGIWAFSLFKSPADEEVPTLPKLNTEVVKDSIPLAKSKIDPPKKEAAGSKLAIGEVYDGGIIFEIDPAGKTGTIAHTKDSGPMIWTEAMEIHGPLGEGWRLPTFDELQIMYRTIGQGATNSGRFADELYWSATSYDANQARLLRFRDGNSSYHYNSKGTHRKFRVRAVRDFSR